MPRKPRTCLIPGCGSSYYARGLCRIHYQQARRGKSSYPLPSEQAPVAERLKRYLGDLDSRGCVPWTGAKTRRGYGKLRVGERTVPAYRLVWELHHGKKISKGRQVNHHCDNPACCNVEHLYIGSQIDNMRDMMTRGRGRQARGEKNGSARLTEAQVLEIRSSPLPQRELAAKYGVDHSSISLIRTGKSWRHLLLASGL